MELLSARIGKAVSLSTRTPRCSHTFPKFLAFCFHTSGPRYNSNKPLEIPMPIGRRPRPNPEVAPPTLVLPPTVSYVDRTTPRIVQAEAEQFLYPLYLRGWRIELIRTKDKNRRIQTPFLTATFVLKDNTSTRNAVQAIHQLEEQEKHDASYEVFLKPASELCIRLQTHSARKWPLGKTNETYSNVTLRDVRFAVLFQRIVQKNEYLLDQSLHQKTFPCLQLYWDNVLSWFPYTDSDTMTKKISKKPKPN